MKTLLKFIFIGFIAVLIAIALDNAKSSHVIIFINNYRLDFSLVGGIILILIAFTILFYLFSIVSGIGHIPELISSWSKNYVVQRHRKYLTLAAINFFAKDYKKSYNVAKRVITSKDTTDEEFVALCIAIESAHVIKNNDKDNLIKELGKYEGRRYRSAKNAVLGDGFTSTRA